MLRELIRWLLPATCAMAALAAQAQGAARTPGAVLPADPLDAAASVAPLTYRSALAGYRRLSEGEPIAWREANETVGRVGGWRAYAREASAPEPAGSAPQATHARPGAAEKGR